MDKRTYVGIFRMFPLHSAFVKSHKNTNGRLFIGLCLIYNLKILKHVKFIYLLPDRLGDTSSLPEHPKR